MIHYDPDTGQLFHQHEPSPIRSWMPAYILLTTLLIAFCAGGIFAIWLKGT